MNECLNPDDLTQEWVSGKLTVERIREYLEKNIGAHSYLEGFYYPMDLENVAECCHALYQWSRGERPLGDFLLAVVENNLSEAVHAADDVNRRALWMYPAFLYNVAPAGWRERGHAHDGESTTT